MAKQNIKFDVSKLMKKKNLIKLAYVFMFLVIMSMFFNSMQTTRETFSGASIVQNDVTMYGRDSCPYCVKMKKQLKDDGILNKMEYIDVESPSGASKFKSINANGVPHFECKSTGKESTGFSPTTTLMSNLGL